MKVNCNPFLEFFDQICIANYFFIAVDNFQLTIHTVTSKHYASVFL